MARTGINSAEARRRVRIAQFAGLGLGVLAAALWVMNVPGLSGSLPAKPAIAEPGEGGPQVSVIQVAKIDREAPLGISERLDLAANRPPAPAEAPTENPAATPTPPPSQTPWKYLGVIEEPTRLLALVSLQGRQKIVSEGMELKMMTPAAEGRPESVDYVATILAISREEIEIEEQGGAKRKIPLESRTARVSWVKNMPTTVQGAAVASGLSPEARARLVAQGIDPGQAERARQAAALASRGRGGVNEAGQAVITTPTNQKMTQAMIEADAKSAKSGRTRAVPTTDADAASVEAADTLKKIDRTRAVD